MSEIRDEGRELVGALSEDAAGTLRAIIEFEKQHIGEPLGFAATSVTRALNNGAAGKNREIESTSRIAPRVATVRFTRVEVEDCGPFRGHSSVELESKNSRQPVTLILGENGSGKSSISELMRWCLYGDPPEKVSPLLHSPNSESPPTSGWVAVCLNGPDGFEYRVERSVSLNLAEQATERLTIKRRIDSSAPWEDKSEQDAAEALVNTLLPKALCDHVFLTGEGLSHSQDEESQQNLAKALRHVLNLEVLSRAEYHLREAEPRMLRSAKKLDRGEPKELEERLSELQGKLDVAYREKKKIQEEIKLLGEKRARLDQVLLKQQVAAERQKERTSWESQKTRAKQDYQEALEKKRELVGHNAYLAPLSSSKLDTISQLIDDLQQKQILPPPVSRVLLENLLNTSSCLCGRSLDASIETDSVNTIKSLMDHGCAPGIDHGFETLNNFMVEARTRCETSLGPDALGTLNGRLKQAVETVKTAEHKLSEIAENLASDPSREVAAIEKERVDAENERERRRMDLAELTASVEQLLAEKKEKESELKKVSSGTREAEAARQAYHLCRELCETVSKLAEIRTKAARRQINTELAKRPFGPKGLVGQISEEFSLQTFESNGNGIIGRKLPAPSTGEILCTALALVRALSEVQHQTGANSDGLELDYTGFPTVIDAPTAPLGAAMIEDVCHWLVKVIKQPILLMNDEHWASSREHLSDSIGACAVCELNTPGATKTIQLADGTEVPFVVSNASDLFSVVKNYGERER